MEYLPPDDHKGDNQKKQAIGLGLIACCMIAMIGVVVWRIDQKEPALKQDRFTFSYQEELPTASDAYLDYGGKYEDVSFDASLFDLHDIGTYEVEVLFADQTFVLPIEIIDDKPPQITFQQEYEAEVYRINGQVQLDALFTVQDISEYTYEITSPKEITEGEQELCVTAQDEFHNEIEACKTLKLTIADLAVSTAEHFSSVKDLLDSFIQSRNLNTSTFAFFYYSPLDHEEYVYNEETAFNAASTIKVPLNMLYYDAYENQKFTPNSTVSLRSSDLEEGDGTTSKDYKLNQQVPLSYLQRQSIVYSDNTATNMLIRNLGGFAAFRKQLQAYSDAKLPTGFLTQNVVNMEYMLDVMKKLYTNKDHYQELIDLMKKASEGEYLQKSTDQFEIAQKYGLYDSYLHTVGIVEAPKPYIVGIYTYNRSDAEQLIPELNTWLLSYQLQK